MREQEKMNTNIYLHQMSILKQIKVKKLNTRSLDLNPASLDCYTMVAFNVYQARYHM
jgi:hypothetical protein